jgi:hypothetical protein
MRNTLLFVVLAACGNDVATEELPDAGPTPDGYERLIEGAWSLPPSFEKYVCVRTTMTRDTWISSLRPVAPLGTHHTVLMVGPPDAPDGITDCTSALVAPAIYASGVGTEPLDLPAGVAVHVKPGQQLLLNLHLFNASDAPLDGTSGVEIVAADPNTIEHEAGVVLAGRAQGLQVPPGLTTQSGSCTTPADVTVFAVAPHMHLLGTHMKVSYASTTGGTARVLMDEPYSFDDQRFHSLSPTVVTTAGGKLTVECTYMNPTGATVVFGEHTEEEMCYALSFIYPAPAVQSCTR